MESIGQIIERMYFSGITNSHKGNEMTNSKAWNNNTDNNSKTQDSSDPSVTASDSLDQPYTPDTEYPTTSEVQ